MKEMFRILTVAVFVLCAGAAQAASLAVTATDGSGSLRLGRVISGLANNQELRLRVSNDDGNRYQVFQQVIEPIVNERGERLDLQVIECASLSSSNAAGTLYLQNADNLSFSEQLVYTSGQNGESDSFRIAYAVRPDLLNTSGIFSGKIVFTLRPIAGGAPTQVFVNVSLESTADWKVMVSGGHMPERVIVRDSGATASLEDAVKVTFSGNMGQQVQVYQEVEFLPQGEDGREIGADVVRFVADGKVLEALRVRDPQPLKKDRVLVYSSQEQQDDFAVYFSMAKELAELEEAGVYMGRVKYIVVANDKESVFQVDLQVHIQPVFSMDLVFPPEGISFTQVLPDQPPMEKEVQVVVRSNMHKPYQVTQQVSTLMRNAKGDEMSPEYFTMKVGVVEGEKAASQFTDFVSVKTGEYPVFVSNKKGAPVKFNVVYRVQGYKGLPSGSYKAPIRFSLNQN